MPKRKDAFECGKIGQELNRGGVMNPLLIGFILWFVSTLFFAKLKESMSYFDTLTDCFLQLVLVQIFLTGVAFIIYHCILLIN